MIDVHCHLNFHAYEKNYDDLIKDAFQKGVSKIINTGTKIDSSEKALELAQRYDNLYAIVGVHPHHADKQDVDSDWISQLENLAKKPKVVGIGEIGLDYYNYKSNGTTDPKMQKVFFEQQLSLAHELNLPIQIHNRHAGKDILEILNHHKNLLKTDFPGMFHCFAGDMNILKGALDLGFMIGFDGNSTYPGLAPGETVALSDIAKATPLDRIVTETDSPFLTPVPFRGTQNMPGYVIIVGEFLAKLKGITFDELDRETEQNAKNLFGI
ncbi:MAG TPA: TatD family hydrolase [Patescibacteria group bacterium]